MMTNKQLQRSFYYWRRRVFLTLWVTYGAFYLCRVNLSVALPGIMRDLGYSKTELGLVGSALFVAYGIGQFINGQLGDKFGARKLISIGIFISGILNIIFGFATNLMVMVTLWGFNGYFQSMGWSPSVKTIANWFSPEERGKISGLYGSSFQVGSAVSWLLAGYLCMNYGWRYAFWVPAFLLLVCGIQFYARCVNSPEDIGFPSIEEYAKNRKSFSPNKREQTNCGKVAEDRHLGLRFTLRQTIGNRKIWIASSSYMLLGIVSYGLLYWIPTYMFENKGVTIGESALRSIIFPLSGPLGAFAVGWLTDKFFGSRRAPMIVLMSILAGIFLLLYPRIPLGKNLLGLFCLGGIGFAIFGAHVTMVTAIPMDYGTRKAASSAAGFIDSLGYLGAAIAGWGGGWLVENYSWNVTFHLLAIVAFVASIPMLTLWRYKPVASKYL